MSSFIRKKYENDCLIEHVVLTDADGGQKPDRRVGRVAVREERLGGVHGEGEGHDGLAAGPHNDALHPQPASEEHVSHLQPAPQLFFSMRIQIQLLF